MAGSVAFRLPDCTSISEEATDDDFLSLLPRSELIRALAEKGLEGAIELLKKEEAKGGALTRRIAAFREHLKRQASRSISHLTREYDRKLGEMDSVRVRSRKLLKDEIEKLRSSVARAKNFSRDSLMSDANLLEAVRSALLVPSDALKDSFKVKRSLLQRLKEFLARLWNALRSLFWRKSGGKLHVPAKKSEGREMTLARLAFLGRALTPDMTGDLFQDLTQEQIEAIEASARKNLAAKGKDLERRDDIEEANFRRQRDALSKESEEARSQASRKAQEDERRKVEGKLTSELGERGWVTRRGDSPGVTYALVERFAHLMLQEEEKALPEGLRMSLRGSASTGIYERGRMRETVELSRIDIPGSLVVSYLRGSRHLIEEEAYVYREIRSESIHAVLLLDVSGSMAEGEKITAAKKALLALYMAIHRRYPDSLIDIVAFDSNVKAMDLVQLWEAVPGSFTNTGEALNVAHQLLRSSRATRKELYLITDGLPESYTDPLGEVRSGNIERSLSYALSRARELATVQAMVSTLVLLKSDNPAYERAARDIAGVLRGYVVVTDPRKLAFELLVRFGGDRVEEMEYGEPKEGKPETHQISATERMARGGTSKERRRARREARLTAA